MKIPCYIIRDLLPLYHDRVCGEESQKQIEEHLETCDACRAERAKLSEEIRRSDSLKEAAPIREIADIWKKSKKAAFFKGALLISLLACVGCLIAYRAIGGYGAADGTLVEPFALIPLSYFFGMLAAISGGCVLLGRRRRK